MRGWITKDSDVVSDQGPAPFELQCQCGQTVKGERRRLYQRTLCKNCGESFFILPVDVYPAIKARKRKSKSIWRRKKHKNRKQKASQETASASTARTLGLGRVRERAVRATIQTVDRTRRMMTPFRLVVLCIVGIIGGTGYWSYTVRAREQAETALKSAADAGHSALREGDFVSAAHAFRMACAALDTIGRDDFDARVIRQLYRESVSATRLSHQSPFEMLNDAEKFLASEDPGDWSEYFRANYRDKWIVMHTTLTRRADSTGRQQYRVEFPFRVGGKPVEFDADLAVFADVRFDEAGLPSHSPASGQPLAVHRISRKREVIFAAQIEHCRLTQGNVPAWIVRLRGDSAFLWSNYENYTQLGFVPDDLAAKNRIKQLLEEQTVMLGIES